MEPQTHDLAELLREIDAIKKRLDALESPECEHKRRAQSLEEMILFLAKCGLPENDARWLWAKMECSGWRNNGKVVRNWHSLVTAWKLANIFPSQKNGKSHSVYELKLVLDAKKAEKDELVRKYYNDSGAFAEWTSLPARQRFIVLKHEIINLTAQIGQSA